MTGFPATFNGFLVANIMKCVSELRTLSFTPLQHSQHKTKESLGNDVMESSET